MKNFTNNFKQFTSRLSARWLIMALMMLVGTSSAWGANLASGQVIQFKFSQGSVSQNSGWNGTVLNMWDNNGNSEQVNVQPGEVYTISEGHWIPTKFQYLSQYDWDGWKGQTAEIGDCGGGSTLLTNKKYEVTLSTSTDWVGEQHQNYPNKQFKHTLSCEDADLCKPTYYIAGTLPGASWDEGKHLEMTTCDRGLRSLTFNGVAAGDYEFKITQGNWGWSTGSYHTDKGNLKCESSGGNIKISTIGLGQTNITIYFDGTKAYASYAAACTTPKASHLTYTDPEYTYDGNTKTAEVKWADDGTNTGITIKYGIDTTAPKNAGNYDLKVSTGAHGDLCPSQEDISLGTFTISPKTPDVNDFVYTNQTVTYNGDAQTATVTWKQGYEKTGEITITYKQGDEEKDPINAGTYDVWVTSAASDNFYATTSAINKGTLRIDLAKITDVPSNFQLSETSYNYGEEEKPTVSLKQSSTLIQAGLGAITTKYYNSSGQEVANPTAVGTYTVKITMTAGNGYSAITEPTVVGTFDITCYKPINPTLSKTDVTRCNGEPKTTGTITITNYAQYPKGCVFYLDGNIVKPTNEGVIENVYFPTENSKTYTVKVTNTCGSTIQESDETQIAIKATDAAPSIGDFEIKYNVSSVCSGTIVQLEATHVNGATYTWYKGNSQDAIEGATDRTYSPSITENSTYRVTVTKTSNGCSTTKEAITGTITAIPQADAPQISPNYMNVCGGDAFKLPNIDGVTWSLDGKPTTGSQPGIANNTDEAIIKTFQAVKEVDGCPSAPADYIVTVNPTPVITGESVAQPGKANAINLKLQDNLVADWSVDPTADFSYTTNINSTAFSAETNGTYTIKATTKEGCSATHEVTVADAFYIYFRNAKKGETAYANFYHSDQNTEEYRGGAMYYAESTVLPTSGTVANFNQGGKEADIITTDCDGYTWYGFKASADVISGSKYFYVHAKNDINKAGWYTHTVPTKVNLTGDVYYTLCETNVNNCNEGSKGWKIVSASAPYAGPKVYASGATALGANKFAALYVTDCSGKEIDAYQWEYCSTQAGTYDNYKASVNNSTTLYSGDAGETNNIRPETLGWYRCKVTYKDRSTLTSKPVQVTGTYTHASSTLPVIIVNTNGVGFPVNNTCETPSAHADDMKEKLSVDVKIYDGSTMVYDRKARMNYRGSSSLNFLKKSYAFCPGKDNCVEDKGRLDYVKTEKMNMLGIGEASDKDWVLYAAAADPSLMRNRLMFDTFRDMTGGWSVNSRYVELYVDGVYKGVYVMMDKITANEKRVNITASNGFIVKFDKTDLADRYEADGDKKTFKSLYSGYDGESGNGMKTYDAYIDQRFEIEYPEMKDVEKDNPGMWAKTVNDIKTLFNNFESNLKAGNYAEVQKIIDYISWADWFIISEYAKNMDAYRASCLFVYNGGKIEARPLWDQELSFNNQCANLCSTYGCNSTTGLLIENSEIYKEGCSAPFWFTGKYVGGRGTEAKDDAQFEGYLLNDPCFIAVLKERWALHTATDGALTQDVMNAKISGYEKDLGSVGTSGTPLYREKNTYWSGKSRKTIDKANSGGTCFTGETGYQDTEISTSISVMKSWITGNRRTNLGTLITNMKGSPLSISFAPQEVITTPWEPVTLQVINTSSYDYTITYTDGELDKQSGVIINKTDDTFKINIPRPDKWGIGNEKVEGERADITYGIKATLNVADGTTVCGNNKVTPATATIILQDEPNEKCD